MDSLSGSFLPVSSKHPAGAVYKHIYIFISQLMSARPHQSGSGHHVATTPAKCTKVVQVVECQWENRAPKCDRGGLGRRLTKE